MLPQENLAPPNCGRLWRFVWGWRLVCGWRCGVRLLSGDRAEERLSHPFSAPTV